MDLATIRHVLELGDAPIPNLVALKRLARRARRRLSKRHHPDHGGLAVHMAEINRVADAVASLERMPGAGADLPAGFAGGITQRRWESDVVMGLHTLRTQPFFTPADAQAFVAFMLQDLARRRPTRKEVDTERSAGVEPSP